MKKEEEKKKTTKKPTTTRSKVKKENIKAEVVEIKKEETKNEISKIEEKTTLKDIIELILIIIGIIVVLVFFPHTVIWNIVVLLLILTVLVFVHEGGHFIAAKKCGVYVYEFALGMGTKILGFKRKNDPTDYSLRLLPIGGYCQMAGEEGEDDENLPKDQFMCNKSKTKRTIILVAGVTMNFITAIVLLFIIALCWGAPDQTNRIGSIAEDSPAAETNLKVGDRIVELNGYKIDNWDRLSIVSATNEVVNADKYVYVIEHENGKREKYEIVPAEYVAVDNGAKLVKVTEENTLDEIIKEYKLDKKKTTTVKKVGIGAITEKEHGIVAAIKYAFTRFVSLIKIMLLTVWYLITGKIGLGALSGPVGMYSVVDQAASIGIMSILNLAAFLSINLGVINILPFPAFDGGRVLFVIIEAITRKKVNPKVENAFHTVGFFLIMALMLYITFHDVMKFF